MEFDKTDMFRNYPQPDDYIPNNHPRCKCHKKLNILAGESTSHSFEIPFNIETDASDYSVIYKLGLTDVIVKNKNELEVIVTEHNDSLITCNLSSVETEVFAHTLLDCHVQIRFTMLDSTIVYTEPNPVTLSTALDVGSESPVPPVPPGPIPPHVITGIGYTED